MIIAYTEKSNKKEKLCRNLNRTLSLPAMGGVRHVTAGVLRVFELHINNLVVPIRPTINSSISVQCFPVRQTHSLEKRSLRNLNRRSITCPAMTFVFARAAPHCSAHSAVIHQGCRPHHSPPVSAGMQEPRHRPAARNVYPETLHLPRKSSKLRTAKDGIRMASPRILSLIMC